MRILLLIAALVVLNAETAFGVTATPISEDTGSLDFDEELSWSFGAKTGYANFGSHFQPRNNAIGANKVVDPTSSNGYTVEFQWFHKKNLATSLGYRSVSSPDLGRNTYQASYAGLKYFPATLGIPIVARRSYNTVRYNFTFKPFVSAEVSSGRQILATDAAGLEDLSSEFVGLDFGGGIHYQLADRYALELSGSYEHAFGMSNHVRARSNNAFMALGALFYY